ncbi:hypothetical protein [uncultured Desulfobacter sp.]|uniref:hypothetical protein n=1 Tax=uncultured Desulfobacter sp. TaxID=240139 RepID=UPI0029F48FDC|nr:hypothetical protein [uncultured Desulfobacter sp.]
MSTQVDPEIEKFFNRINELESEGIESSHASGIAQLEQRIERWAAGDENDLLFLIYGDFEPLEHDYEVGRLGLTVYAEKIENSIIRNVRTVHKARIQIKDKTIESILDASRRINLFLGVYTLVTWTNCHCGWWSILTHGNSGGGVLAKLNHEDLERALDGAIRMDPKISDKVEAALFWVREPKRPMMDMASSELIKIYAAYWNAFECLVDAICVAIPREKMTKIQKQEKLSEILSKHSGEITTGFIQEAYSSVVNPGLKAKAIHALNVCFKDSADYFIHECFEREDKINRLYDIRNSINHGVVKAENPIELARIESRLSKLSIMIMGMLGQIIPYPYPLHRESGSKKDG